MPPQVHRDKYYPPGRTISRRERIITGTLDLLCLLSTLALVGYGLYHWLF